MNIVYQNVGRSECNWLNCSAGLNVILQVGVFDSRFPLYIYTLKKKKFREPFTRDAQKFRQPKSSAETAIVGFGQNGFGGLKSVT